MRPVGTLWSDRFSIRINDALRIWLGGAALLLILVVLGSGLGVGFSPLATQALVHVPLADAADASGLLTTTMQLGQVIGVATFGSLFLTLARPGGGEPARQQSAHAVSAVDGWLALVLLAGAALALLLARAVVAGSPVRT